MDYVTADTLAAFGHEFDGLQSLAARELLVTSASRLFDNLCEVEDGFFAEASGEYDKVFFGTGTQFLHLPPYVSLGTDPIVILDDNDNELDIPAYYEKPGHILQIKGALVRDPVTGRYPSGWYSGKEITVSANWGWEATPADVSLATVHLAFHMWRTADPAFATISNAAGDGVASRTVPKIAQVTIDKYREKYSRRALFA